MAQKIKLNQNLILFEYILQAYLNGAKNLKGVSVENLNQLSKEGYNEDNVSYFVLDIILKLGLDLAGQKDKFLEYDRNIFNHTKRINEKRTEKVSFKYFQYLALLFTEIYLDNYFGRKTDFIEELNKFVGLEKKKRDEEKHFTLDFDESFSFNSLDLSKIAYWMATGSGKTLLMHINILQLDFYLNKYKVRGLQERFLLITPNESLTKQHLIELAESGIKAEELNTSNSGQLATSYGSKVSVIDIHKLKDKEGEKTIASDSLGNNNVVFIDEGHRGMSGNDWKETRDKLSSEGFSLEYSATFGQAIKYGTAKNSKDIFEEYAKSILFDYSYKYFYEDGYGKEYNIINLKEDTVEQNTNLYLTATFLTFIQQLVLFHENKKQLNEFNISEPLMIFVGNSVVGSMKNKGDEATASDITKILNFLDYFTKEENRERVKLDIKSILEGTSGLNNDKNNDLFAGKLKFLHDKYVDDIDQIIKLTYKLFFNSESFSGNLQVTNLKGQEGEIGVSLTNSKNYFGLINIGDVSGFLKHLQDHSEVRITPEQAIKQSYFQNINSRNSTIQLLIGSKKFTEGWNSWRVSTMGLLNIGKSEGAQVIQLFGRGVRLKGFQKCLKRSSALESTVLPRENIPSFILPCETINVFGIKADYITTFKEYLEEEGISSENSYVSIKIPVFKNNFNKSIKTIQVPDSTTPFKKATTFSLDILPQQVIGTLKNNPIEIDLFSKLQGLESKNDERDIDTKSPINIPAEFVELIDIDNLYFAIQQFKAEKGWSNFSITKNSLREILKLVFSAQPQVRVYGPKSLLINIDNYKTLTISQEQIITPIIKEFCKKVFDHYYEEYYANYREYLNISEINDKSLELKEYEILVREDELVLRGKIEELANNEDLIKNITGKSKVLVDSPITEMFNYSRHLYIPLFHSNESGDGVIKIKPVALNSSETKFVNDLKEYTREQFEIDFPNTEIYLLRNQSKGVGLGFYEANNFYPDFMLWLIKDGIQYLTFIDPKGIRNMRGGFSNPKIQFKHKIKEIEKNLSEKSEEKVILNSFILSDTLPEEIDWRESKSKEEFEGENIVFMKFNGYVGSLVKSIIK